MPGRAAQLVRMAEGRAGPEIDQAATRAEFCAHGSGPCGCGSGPPRLCGHPDHPAEVRRAYCIACRARDAWESGAEGTA